MAKDQKIKLYAFTIDCKEPYELAQFYAELLSWEIVFCDDDYVCVAAPGTAQGMYPGLTFQRNPDYMPPVWPERTILRKNKMGIIPAHFMPGIFPNVYPGIGLCHLKNVVSSHASTPEDTARSNL